MLLGLWGSHVGSPRSAQKRPGIPRVVGPWPCTWYFQISTESPMGALADISSCLRQTPPPCPRSSAAAQQEYGLLQDPLKFGQGAELERVLNTRSLSAASSSSSFFAAHPLLPSLSPPRLARILEASLALSSAAGRRFTSRPAQSSSGRALNWIGS